MINLLVKPLLDVASTAVTGFVQTKKAKAELAVTEVKAKQKLKEDMIAGRVQWEQEAVSQMETSWKDEFWTLVFGAILLGCFLPWTQPYVERGFVFLEQSTPSWFSTCLILIISASFGIKTVKGAAGLLTKKKG
mgnify:FL=1|tara:strand:- start:814 stop:1215 length:402 start_codon:yes stop_codon:yes gene_type:complete